MLRLFDTKNRFLRRIIPQLRPIGELVREKNEAMDRAEKAEISVRRAIKEEIKALQEENRKLRDQNFDLIGSARGKFLAPTTSLSSSFVCLLMLSCLCSPRGITN